MKATLPQIKRIHMLLPKAVKDDKELKAELVYQYTGDPNKTSTKDLEVSQAKRLISDLVAKEHLAGDSQRKKILSICHEMGWHTEGTTKLDWQRIGAFNEKYGTLKARDLNAYTGRDLSTLVTQYERVLEHEYKR